MSPTRKYLAKSMTNFRHVPERPFFRSRPFFQDQQPSTGAHGRGFGPASEHHVASSVDPGVSTGLPGNLKQGVEFLSGLSMDDVRVHYNSPQPATLQALAYTQGRDVYIAPRQEQSLAHEAWHVVQQMTGEVRPTRRLPSGLAVNDEAKLEREADVMGDMASQLSSTDRVSTDTGARMARQARPVNLQSGRPSVAAIQRQMDHDAPVYNFSYGRADKVEIANLRGIPYGPSANPPSVDTWGWPQLAAAGHTLKSAAAINTHYNAVRMHLWNGRLGGPGNDWKNLAPGPAQVNSAMSAGPETGVKDAVDLGYTVWLETAVTYAANPGLNTDFTTVIPQNISMKSGYMLDGKGKKCRNGATGVKEMAPKVANWNPKPIDQPAGAMTPMHRLAFTAPGLTPATLDTNLGQPANQSPQVRAQVYGLVTPALKKHMLLNYPEIYLGMSDEDQKESVVTTLDDAEVYTLIATTLAFTQAVDIRWVLSLIYDNSIKLQSVFGRFTGPMQTELAKSAKGEILHHLGNTVLMLARNDYSIFKLLRRVRKFDVLEALDKSEIDSLLGVNPYLGLFDDWAKSRGGPSAGERRDYLKPRISNDKWKSYEKDKLAAVERDERSQEAQENYPIKTRHAKARSKPYSKS